MRSCMGEIASCFLVAMGRCHDVAADRRPQCLEEGQDHERAGITIAVEPAIEHQIGEVNPPAMAEIHQQEGKIIGSVRAGQGLAEIDAVKEDGAVIDQADIIEMEIAMAVAHITEMAAPVDLREDRYEGLIQAACDILEFTRIQGRYPKSH